METLKAEGQGAMKESEGDLREGESEKGKQSTEAPLRAMDKEVDEQRQGETAEVTERPQPKNGVLGGPVASPVPSTVEALRAASLQAATGSSGGANSPSRSNVKRISSRDLRSSIHRVTSRADLVRQSSASLLRPDTTPSLLRQSSGIHLFPEDDEAGGVILFYTTDWPCPFVHFCPTGGEWTKPFGMLLSAMTEKEINAISGAFGSLYPISPADRVWSIVLPAIEGMEFVMTNGGRVWATDKDGSRRIEITGRVSWDKAPSGSNYHIGRPGVYGLKDGRVVHLVEPPEKPALLELNNVSASSVSMIWNAPLLRASDVAGYHLYRDGKFLTAFGDKCLSYEDTELIGLTRYVYTLYAVNDNGGLGKPSDPLEVTTGEPGKLGPVEGLVVASTSETFVQISWQRPFDLGGNLISCYKIYRDGKEVAIKPSISGSLEQWTDANVTANEFYVYNVTACRKLVTTPVTVDYEDENLNLKDPEVVLQLLTEAISASSDEGLPCKGVIAKTVSSLVMPSLGDSRTHIILQCFNWSSCFDRDGWFKKLTAEVGEMAEAGVTMAWLPPPTASVSPQGYMPSRWYDLETDYGTERELRDLIGALRGKSVAPMLDFVGNHRCGVKQDKKGQWTIFEDPDWGPWAIVCNNKLGYEGFGAADTGATSTFAPDIDHTNRRVREDTKQWLKWLFDEIGFASLRIDMAPGYAPKYQVEYTQSLGGPYTVAEYWSGDRQVLQNYLQACKGMIAAYDFALYYILRRSVEGRNYYELNHENGKVPGLAGVDPRRAVTFLDNHDTVHIDYVGKFAHWIPDKVLQGYAYLMTHPGVPCIFYDHLFKFDGWFREKLKRLCALRRQMGLRSTSGVHIDAAGWEIYAAYISSDTTWCHKGGGNVALKLGSAHWKPEGGRWKVAIDGKDFCVWTRT